MCHSRQHYPKITTPSVWDPPGFSSRQCLHTQALLLHLLTARSQGAASFCAPHLVRLPDQVLSAMVEIVCMHSDAELEDRWEWFQCDTLTQQLSWC